MSSSAELDAAIRENQLILSGIFSKPKCPTKLLTKPPFRFIHDIVTAIIGATGFPDGLYHPSELDSANFRSKEAKIRFLSEIIRLVGICEGSPLEVKASKIVAGLEPLHTNRLLVGLGKAAMNPSLDRGDVVQRCLAGESPGQTSRSNMLKDNTYQPSRLGKSDDFGFDAKKKSSPSTFAIPELSGLSLSNQIALCNFDKAQTRSWVGHVVAKPKCPDKLLNRPPFRFLHDLIIAVSQATTFGLKIYTQEEMTSSNISNKAAKMKFLEKTIQNVSAELSNCAIEAKAANIVAGLEPGHVCRLLQLLVVAAIQSKEADAHNGNVSGFENEGDPSVKNSDPGGEFGGLNLNEEAVTSSFSQRIETSQIRAGSQDYESAREATSIGTLSGEAEVEPKQSTKFDNFTKKQQEIVCKVSEFEGLSLADRIALCNFDMLQTGAWIGQLISRPKCSQKLLQRPPFRFLHDLIMAIGRETGFGMEIFTNEQKESSNMRDKTSKIKFLEKSIAVTSSAFDNVIIEANPTNIIAGLDCQSTCKFLQLLVVASTWNKYSIFLDKNDVCSKDSPIPDKNENNFIMPSSEDESVAADLSLGRSAEILNADITASRTNEANTEIAEPEHSSAEVLDCRQDLPILQNLIDEASSGSGMLPFPSDSKQDTHSLIHSSSHNDENEGNDASKLLENFFGTENDMIIKDDVDLIISKTEVRSMRPTTARRRPPRVKAKIVPTTPPDKLMDKPEILSDGDDAMGEEPPESLSLSTTEIPLPAALNISVGENDDNTELYHKVDDHLAIVQRIVNDEEEAQFPEESKDPSGLLENQGVRLRLNLKKRSKTISAPTEIQAEANAKTMCSIVQTLVQSTAPLGTCMDYVQDDIEKIIKEREMWYAKYREHLHAYKQAQQKGKGCTMPLRRNIESVEVDIIEQKERTKALKATISRNEFRIKKLLHMMVF